MYEIPKGMLIGSNNVQHTFRIEVFEVLPVDTSSTVEERISLNGLNSKTFIGIAGECTLVKVELCIILSLCLCEVTL
jgi:hypothetical protein